MKPLENIKNEIHEILYILNDEGIECKSINNYSERWGDYLTIKIGCESSKHLYNSGYFLEFLERINSISELNGRSCSLTINKHKIRTNVFIAIHEVSDDWDSLNNWQRVSVFLHDSHYYPSGPLIESYKMKHIKPLTEVIKIDIKVGDVVLGGRFKNKKIKVKKIGKNKKGDLTINGKPLLRFRIIDQESIKEGYSGDKKKDIANLKKIEEEVKEISFILRDVNVEPMIFFHERSEEGPWINIQLHQFDENFGGTTHVGKKVPVDEYDEFFYRVKDIVEKYRFKALRASDKVTSSIFILHEGYDRRNLPTMVSEANTYNFNQEEWCIKEILKEIKPLEYILVDDGLEIEVTHRLNSRPEGNCITIKFTPPKQPMEAELWNHIVQMGLRDSHIKKMSDLREKRKLTYQEWLDGLTERDSYREYYDRVKEIAEKYGYVITNENKYDIEIYHKQSTYDTHRTILNRPKHWDGEDSWVHDESSIFERIITKIGHYIPSNHNTSSDGDAIQRIYKIKKEINELKYILNDVNIRNMVDVAWDNLNDPWIDINFTENVTDFEEYLEYFDRVRDISEKYGFKALRIDNDKKGYIFIHLPEHDMVNFTRRGNLLYESSHKRHRKAKKDFSIESLKKEIEDLEYILNDDNISIGRYGDCYSMWEGHWINLLFDTPKKFIGYYEYYFDPTYIKWKDELVSRESFLEWVDRVSDVCKKYGYVLDVKTNVTLDIKVYHPGYIGWKKKLNK